MSDRLKLEYPTAKNIHVYININLKHYTGNIFSAKSSISNDLKVFKQ